MKRPRRSFSLSRRPTKQKNRYIYYVRFRDENGKYQTAFSTGKTNRTAAELWVNDFIAKGITPPKRDYSFSQFTENFWDYEKSSYIQGRLANPDQIAQAIARTHGWTIVPGGETALNLLGISTQVPSSWEYLSDGPYRSYEWLGNTMTFKQRTNKETTILSPKTALIVQALKSLGENNLNKKVISTLSSHIEEKEKKKIVKEAKFVTAWIYEVIREICQ